MQIADIVNRYAVKVFKVGKNIVYEHNAGKFFRTVKVDFQIFKLLVERNGLCKKSFESHFYTIYDFACREVRK